MFLDVAWKVPPMLRASTQSKQTSMQARSSCLELPVFVRGDSCTHTEIHTTALLCIEYGGSAVNRVFQFIPYLLNTTDRDLPGWYFPREAGPGSFRIEIHRINLQDLSLPSAQVRTPKTDGITRFPYTISIR